MFIALLFISCVSIAYAADDNINQTDIQLQVQNDGEPILEQQDQMNESKLSASPEDTYIDAPNEVSYDVIGQKFEVRLLTQDNQPITDAKITISIDGVNHELKTDSNGKTSLQIRLDDGQYQITTKFDGTSSYKSCSKQTSLYINNTKVVGENLSNLEIQEIINNAKANNVLLFKGDVYENVNLVIDKRLTLIGNGNTLLKSNDKNAIFEILGKSSSLTSISGFNIQSGGDGIIIKNSDYVTVNKNTISSKGNGIIAENVRYLEISNNVLDKNGENGIILAFADDCNIINNQITSNSKNGIGLSKSNRIYIYYNAINNNKGNGIYTSDKIDDNYYGDIPSDLHIGNNEINANSKSGIHFEKMGENLVITSNTINGNYNDGIIITQASYNVNITYNTINYNIGNGISISDIKNNNMYYNLITANTFSGIKFNYDYILPRDQDIRFNVILSNPQNEIEASETIYSHALQLQIGENWYGGELHVCPKVKTENINLEINQVDVYLFNMTFYDSDKNILSQLPPRIVSHKVNNGRSRSFVLYNGTGTFERDASDEDIVYVTIDLKTYSIVYKSDDPDFLHLEYPPYSPNVRPIEDVGKPYPNLPRPGLLEDIYNDESPGSGDGNGYNVPSGGNSINGNGNGGTSPGTGVNGNGNGMTNKAGSVNGNTNHETSDGNGTAIQSSSSNSNPSNNVGANSNAPASNGGSSSQSQSVVKQIIINDEDVIRVMGLPLIILLILLTIACYYRDDIKQMKSKI